MHRHASTCMGQQYADAGRGQVSESWSSLAGWSERMACPSIHSWDSARSDVQGGILAQCAVPCMEVW